MSSTSSSECVCGECHQYSSRLENDYGRSYRKAPRTPFYPIMGQPLVYYAQVQEPMNMRPKKENGKSNANCFVKAFKWYTQEHIPSQTSDSPNTNTDTTGFATWLDTKYNEFLHDSHQNQASYRLKLKQTSTIEAERITDNATCEPCSTKKYTRSRRPWGKRWRKSSKEATDDIEKSSKSFEYILQPKDLAHPDSICCHPTPTCCNQSNATFLNIEDSKKTMLVKSFSMTSMRQDKNNEVSIDTVTVQEEIKANRDTDNDKKDKFESKIKPAKESTISKKSNSHKISCECIEEAVVETVNIKKETKTERDGDENKIIRTIEPKGKTSKQSNNVDVKKQSESKRTKEVSCQCIEETAVKKDAQTQCTFEKNNSLVLSQKCCIVPIIDESAPNTLTQTRRKEDFVDEGQENNANEKNQRIHQSNQCSVEYKIKVDAHCQYKPDVKTCFCFAQDNLRKEHQEIGPQYYDERRLRTSVKEADSFIVENLATLTKATRSFTIFVNDAAQTSDHSISISCFTKDTIHEYPLFMKILCADKLNEELKL